MCLCVRAGTQNCVTKRGLLLASKICWPEVTNSALSLQPFQLLTLLAKLESYSSLFISTAGQFADCGCVGACDNMYLCDNMYPSNNMYPCVKCILLIKRILVIKGIFLIKYILFIICIL